MNIDNKLLSLVGKTQVIPFREAYSETNISKKITIGKNIGIEEIYQSVNQHGVNFIVQEQQDHFVYNLLMAAIINKYPDAFLKKPLPTILRSTTESEENKLSIVFSSSKDRHDVMRRAESFLNSNKRLASIKDNIMLITNELMTNALYCAPSDKLGTNLFIDTKRSDPVSYPNGLKAEINLSFNDSILVVGCRDPFGSVNKSKVTGRLQDVFQRNKKAIIKNNKSDRGGSGLGLKIIIESSSGFGMVVKKGHETFVYATLPLGKGHKSIEQMAKNLCLNFYQ